MPELNERDLKILEHVSRYRLTTHEFLHQLFFKDTLVNAVTKVTSRLTEGQWLTRRDLPRGRSYFTPGGRTARLFQLRSRSLSPFSEQTLPAAYGTLADCVASGNSRLTEFEFEKYLPALAIKGITHQPHVIDKTQDKHRLALLVVDRDNSPERLLMKTADAIKKRREHESYRKLIHGDGFSVRIVTSTAAKRADVERLLARREDRSVPVVVAVAPELAHVWPERIGRGMSDAAASR